MRKRRGGTTIRPARSAPSNDRANTTKGLRGGKSLFKERGMRVDFPNQATSSPRGATPEDCGEELVPGLRRLGKLQASWSGFPTARPSRL